MPLTETDLSQHLSVNLYNAVMNVTVGTYLLTVFGKIICRHLNHCDTVNSSSNAWTWNVLIPHLFQFAHGVSKFIHNLIRDRAKQSHYRPGQALRVPGG